jgi:pimeloyl-ACP methyl ester carboxylesterase
MAAAPEAPPAVGSGTATAEPAGSWECITSPSGSPRLWRYVLPGQNAAIDTGLDTVVLIHGWLGSGVSNVPTSPLGFNAGLNGSAVNLASASRQVLFLDWGQQALDPNPAGLAPYNPAGRINAVAAWAKTPLQPLADSGKRLTLVGFSLGSYVAAQTAAQLGSGSNLRLVSLDPAATGLQGAYDLDGSNASADPVPNLASAAPAGSLAFVVADTNLTIGLAGDNTRAGTAQRSFVVKGFASNTLPGDAHGAIPALYADLARYLDPDAAVTEAILGGFRANQYNNSANLSGARPHEGVATLRSNQGAIARLEGFTSAGTAQTVTFVDSQDSTTPSGSSRIQDTVVTLRDLELSSGASVERLVLGGSGAINGTGNAAAQELIGNTAANRLQGKGGLDRLTGDDGGDTFVYGALSDALVGGSSTLRAFEWITDFNADQDQIDAPGNGQRTLSNLGSVGSLSDFGLRSLLSTSNFVAGGAALFQFGSGANERLFLGLNDGTAGFNPLVDGIIELTGLQGNALSLVVS